MKTFKQFCESSVPKSHVCVDKNQYKEETGKCARGDNLYRFKIGATVMEFSGTYTEAKKKAVELASRNGVKEVIAVK